MKVEFYDKEGDRKILKRNAVMKKERRSSEGV
jgi:hypothetical protein